MNKKLFIKLVTCILLVSCVLISCTAKVSSPSSNFNIIGNYYLFRESINHSTLKIKIQEEFHTVIPANVSHIAYNDEFIVIKQLGVKLNGGDIEELKNNKQSFYWIIDLKDNYIFNRLKEEEFNKIQKDLKIPRDLGLKYINNI